MNVDQDGMERVVIYNVTPRSARAIQRVTEMDHVDAIPVSAEICAKHAKSDCTVPIAQYSALIQKRAIRMADAP